MFDYRKYLRMSKMPHIWCPGCGDGIVMKALIRAVDKVGLDKDKVALVSGIGCSSRLPGYMDFNTLHTTHGRPLAFATGIKMVRPELHVLVVTGDGDATAIGGNHFIHACRRNIGMTVILFNNSIYGMTGGQYSPTTPEGFRTSTSPYGHVENAFDIGGLAVAAGANFVARSTTHHVVHLSRMLEVAMQKKGFRLVEVICQCPTYFGRKNRQLWASDMMNWYKEISVNVEKAKGMSPEELEGKVVIGVLADRDRPEYTEQYEKVIATAQEEVRLAEARL
ncbi:MAG: 2-oxoacid:ferredoxin oxidoreductase subunit beta [Nitrospinota bacterium]